MDSAREATYYLILHDIVVQKHAMAFDVAPEELTEIEQIGRLVSQVTEEHPIFMTST